LLTVASLHATGAQNQTPPQTARQALLEIVLDRTAGAWEKHLPEAARRVLVHGGDIPQMQIVRQLTYFRAGISANGGELETFESGPLLLAIEEKASQHKVEIVVERDDLTGDADEIELSVRSYSEGQPESLPVVPRIILSMKQEKDVWKLSEITVALHVPLSDPDYLKGLKKIQNSNFESAATEGLRAINTAQVIYSRAFPERGFTCTLSTLGVSETQGDPSPEHAMMIDDSLASGNRNGYIFSITGCDIPPASRYRATAVPADPSSGMLAFCSDESGVIRYSADGHAATCLSEGVPTEK
jgi:type IV pilus assembly protein PilA